MSELTNADEFSTIATPPDFLVDANPDHTILIVDAEWSDIEDFALYLKTSTKSYGVYVYHYQMNDTAWLEEAASLSSVVIINTDPTPLSPIKDKLVLSSEAFYYGSKRFLMSSLRIKKPIDWLIQHEQITE